MKQETIQLFQNYLEETGLKKITIIGYVREICLLGEPPGTEDPFTLLDYAEQSLSQRRKIISNPRYAVLRAALNSFLRMKLGCSIRELRSQRSMNDQYSDIICKYIRYCNDYLSLSEPVTRASVREIKSFLCFAVPDINRVDWKSVTSDTVIEFLAEKRSNICPASIGVTVTAIRRFFRFLQYDDVEIHTSLVTLPLSVPVWSKNAKLPIVLSQEELSRLMNYSFPETIVGIRDHTILLCFTELGLRCSEVAKLQLDDILWNHSTIIIRKTKTHAERELPLSRSLGVALEKYVIYARPIALQDALFFKSKTRPLEPATTHSIRAVIRRLYSAVGIDGWHVGTHAIRRTVGTNLYSAGNDLKTVADLLGHTSVSTTTAYVHVDIESLREVASPWPRRERHE